MSGKTEKNSRNMFITGRRSNIHIGDGLDEKQVKELIEKVEENILKHVIVSESNTKSNTSKSESNIKSHLSKIVEEKVLGVIYTINPKLATTEKNIKAEIQQQFSKLKKNSEALVKEILEDYNGLVLHKIDSIENKLDRLLDRYSWENEQKIPDAVMELLIDKRDVELQTGKKRLFNANFEEAISNFDTVINSKDESNRALAYFFKALSQCKIQPIWDYADDKYIFICYDYMIDFETFANALGYASPELKAEFNQCISEIRETLKAYQFLEQEVKADYDCFVCVKVNDDGNRTEDAKWVDNTFIPAVDKYNEQFKSNPKSTIKVFYSEINANNEKKGSREYNAHIQYALSKAKVMLLVCSKKEYLHTPWVKNEYRRFCYYLDSKGESKYNIIIVFDGEPVELPDGLRSGKFVDHNRKINSTTKKETDSVESLIKRIDDRIKETQDYIFPNFKYCLKCDRRYNFSAKACMFCDEPLLDAVSYANEKLKFTDDVNKKINKQLNDELAKRQKFEAQSTLLKKQAEESKRLIEQEKKNLAVQKQEFAKQQKEESQRISAEKQQLEQKQTAIRDEQKKLSEVRKKILSDISNSDILYESIKITLENYNEGEFDIEGTVLKRYIGSDENVIIPSGVTEIGVEAFEGCDIKSVTFPKSVKRIGFCAFAKCDYLQRVYIEDIAEWCTIKYDLWEDFGNGIGHELFRDYSLYLNGQLVTELCIPNGVVEIGNGMFGGCNSIRSVTLSDGVKKIGDCSFYGCKSLESVKIPRSVNMMGRSAFSACKLLKIVHINDIAAWCGIKYELTKKGGFAFDSSYMLCLQGQYVSNVVIPDGVKTINANAFNGCQSIYKVTIPDDVQSIGSGAFYHCPNLRELIVPNGLSTLNSIFSLCLSLQKVVVPTSVKRIKGHNIFWGCTSLKEISYEGTKEQWKAIDKEIDCSEGEVSCIDGTILINENAKFEIVGTVLIRYNGHESEVVIPDKVTRIENHAFTHCGSFLKKVVFPASLESMGNNVFGFYVEKDVSRVIRIRNGKQIIVK